MTPSKETLHHLANLASVLNEKTDTFNEGISKLNERLNSMQLGVTIWLTRATLLFNRVIDNEATESLGERESAYHGWRLGYCKIGDSWCIAAKAKIEVFDDDNEWVRDCREWNPVPLGSEPRVVRLHAAAYIDELLDGLGSKAEQLIRDVEKTIKVLEEECERQMKEE